MVRIGPDLLVLAGFTNGATVSDSIYKLTCTNNLCEWETLPQKIPSPSGAFVAIPVPDDFIHCSG